MVAMTTTVLWTALLLSLLSLGSGCRDGYDTLYNGYCMVDKGRLAPFFMAHSLCSEDEAFLPMITSQSDNDHLVALTKAAGYSSIPIGIRCQNKWEWGDGTLLSTTNFSNFAVSEERKWSASCFDYSVYSLEVETGKWVTVDVDTPLPVICQQKKRRPVTEPCDYMDYRSYDTSTAWLTSCHKLVNSSLTWSEAATECRRREISSSLSSIHSAQINKDLWRPAASKGVEGVHLGLSRGMGGEFVWDDGSATDYDNFPPGYSIGKAGNCTFLNSSSDDRYWANGDCNAKRLFYCSIPFFSDGPYNPYNPWNAVALSRDSSCSDGKEYGKGDQISSPGFPFGSSSGSDCEFRVKASEGQSIEMEIMHFETNACCDSLVFYEGDSDKELARLSGSAFAPGHRLHLPVGEMRVKWETRSESPSTRGWHLKVL